MIIFMRLLLFYINLIPLIKMIKAIMARNGFAGNLDDNVLPNKTPGIEPSNRFND